MDGFSMLDKYGKGWLTGSDFLETLADFNIFPHKDDVFLLVRHYDRDGDGRILYSDFCDAFSPLHSATLQCLGKRGAHFGHNGVCKT